METNNNGLEKSEILFLYESSYSIPNGDPFTGEQRYDDETKKILVSDVRIKRFIRDYFAEHYKDEIVYLKDDKQGKVVSEDDNNEGDKDSDSSSARKISGSGLRMQELKEYFKDDPNVYSTKTSNKTIAPLLEAMQSIINSTSAEQPLNTQELENLKKELFKLGRAEKNLAGKIDKFLKTTEDKDKSKLADDVIRELKRYVEKNSKPVPDAAKILKKCIDVRLFGGISTEGGDTANITGAVQFAMLNPSLNRVDLRMHQNTFIFVSKAENKQGAIATGTVVPYAVCQIHGWINPLAAQYTGLQAADIDKMFDALWASVNNANTRSKSNQNSLLLLQFVYSNPNKKIYGVDRLIEFKPKNGKQHEQIRNIKEYDLDVSMLKDAVAKSDAVSEVRFYTEHDGTRSHFEGEKKFKPLELFK